MSINVVAEGETYVQALGGFKDDAGGDAHAVATIGFDIVFYGSAGEVSQLIAGATIIAQKLVVPRHAGVSLPLGAVVAMQRLGIGDRKSVV